MIYHIKALSVVILTTLNNFKKFYTAEKKLHQFEKTFLCFFKNVVGTFCATCTVTGYPCFNLDFVNISSFLSVCYFRK